MVYFVGLLCASKLFIFIAEEFNYFGIIPEEWQELSYITLLGQGRNRWTSHHIINYLKKIGKQLYCFSVWIKFWQTFSTSLKKSPAWIRGDNGVSAFHWNLLPGGSILVQALGNTAWQTFHFPNCWLATGKDFVPLVRGLHCTSWMVQPQSALPLESGRLLFLFAVTEYNSAATWLSVWLLCQIPTSGFILHNSKKLLLTTTTKEYLRQWTLVLMLFWEEPSPRILGPEAMRVVGVQEAWAQILH